MPLLRATPQPLLSRRLVVGALPLLLAGCAAPDLRLPDFSTGMPMSRSELQAIYGPVSDGGFDIPAVNIDKVDPRVLRRVVAYDTTEKEGTIVVDTADRAVYLVMEGGNALRYGAGVGREGFTWSGRAKIGRTAKWPRWYPPAEMMARDPRAAKYADGMDGGLANPIGARALYLYEDGRDTLYRLHGTNEPGSIGKAVSSGCIRMFNQDIIDLYDRVKAGTPVVVLS